MVDQYTIKIDLPALMISAAKDSKSYPICVGFQLACVRLETIAKQAIKTGDTVILEELKAMGFVE